MKAKVSVSVLSLLLWFLVVPRIDAQQQGVLISGPTLLEKAPDQLLTGSQADLWVEAVYQLGDKKVHLYLFDREPNVLLEDVSDALLSITCSGLSRPARSLVYQGKDTILIYESIEPGYSLIFAFPDVDMPFCDFIQEFLAEWQFFRRRQDSIIPPPFPAILNFS